MLDDLPSGIWDCPQGEVDLLLGLRNTALHGKTEREVGNLRVLQSPLGCGWSLKGTHQDLRYPNISLTPSLSAAAHLLGQPNLEAIPVHSVLHASTEYRPPFEFHEVEELGTMPQPACMKCRRCRDCTFRRRQLTGEEQAVVARIEKEMWIDRETSTIHAKYPWKPCVGRMRDNYHQALKVQTNIEKHMILAGTHHDYLIEMKKALDGGKVRLLSKEEMESWHGPCHYITSFAVVKLDSVTTKTQIVSNSAMRNSVSELSLNQCMWPGPNALCGLLQCLIFWRSVAVALMLDLRKAYQSIHTSPTELHLRRFLHREDPARPWEVYAYTRATFGNLAAGLVLSIAKRRVADEGMGIDAMAAEQLKEFTYVDDLIMGGTVRDVERMRGVRIDGQYSGTIPQILALGRLEVKFMAISGSDDKHEEEQPGGKALGVGYYLKRDLIHFQLRPGFYLSKGLRADQARVLRILNEDDIQALKTGNLFLSRRQVLSMVMGVYDPLGLISPALVKGKLLLRRLYGTGGCVGWDQDLVGTKKSLWADWFQELSMSPEVVFPRSTRPKEVRGKPRMVGFGDASLLAICAMVYIVWEDAEGNNQGQLMLAKCPISRHHHAERRTSSVGGNASAVVDSG